MRIRKRRKAPSRSYQKASIGPSMSQQKTGLGYGGNLGSFPPKHYGIFNYVDPLVTNRTINLTGGAGHFTQTSNYVCNTLFQIQGAVGAVMPGLTEWGSIYNNYRVNGCKIEVDFVNTSGTPIICYAIVNPQQGSITVIDGTTTWLQIMALRGERGVAMATVGGGANVPSMVTLVLEVNSFKRHFGDKQFDTDTDYTGALGSNPAKLFNLQIGIFRVDAVITALASAVAVDFRLKLFTCLFNGYIEES